MNYLLVYVFVCLVGWLVWFGCFCCCLFVCLFVLCFVVVAAAAVVVLFCFLHFDLKIKMNITIFLTES